MKRNRSFFTRFLALFAMACLLLTALPGMTPARAAGSNLLDDGSFEAVGTEGFKDYTSGWDFYWFAPLSNEGTMASQAEYVIRDSANAHDGEYYIRNDKTGWYGIAEPSVELAKGNYEFSAWVKAVEGTLKVNLTVDEGPAGCVVETDTLGTSVEIPEGNAWVQIKMRFSITEEGTYRVRLGMNSIGQETVEYHFDDFSLLAVDGPDGMENGKIYVSEAGGDGPSGGADVPGGEGACTVEMTADQEVISNLELTTSDGLEKNKAYLTIVVRDSDGNELALKDLSRADCLSWETSDADVAIVKGNYKAFYVYGIAPGEATLTLKVAYNGTVSTASVDIRVEGSALKDGGFEGATEWHTNPYWNVVVGKEANEDSWGYDVNSTFNMTGGNNMYIRMPNGSNTATDGTVLVYQDIYLSPDKYNFAAYIRRFPGFEQQDTVDGYDSYNTPVTVGVILLDADGNETETKWTQTYQDDYKMGVGDFEACSVAFEVTQAGTYRLYLLAESEIHVGMGMQVDNMCLVSGQQIDRVEASFGTNNTVKVGSAEPLFFKAYYADGSEADIGDVRPAYVSSNTEVLTITSDNKVFGMAAGTANIYASVTVNGVEYKCTIEATVEDDTAPVEEDPETPDYGIWFIIGGICLAAAAAAVVIILLKKKKAA